MSLEPGVESRLVIGRPPLPFVKALSNPAKTNGSTFRLGIQGQCLRSPDSQSTTATYVQNIISQIVCVTHPELVHLTSSSCVGWNEELIEGIGTNDDFQDSI